MVAEEKSKEGPKAAAAEKAAPPVAEEKKEASAAEKKDAPATDKKEAAPVRRRKGKKNVPNGIVYISSTFNNTLITVADTNGNTISWSSAGSKGFRGSRKNTPFAAQVAAEDAVRKAMDHGMRNVSVEVRGPGAGRESALRAVASCGLRVNQIKDTTPIPHNGCRPPKRRRV